MADAEIEVLIKVVDEMSGKLTDIEGRIDNYQKANQNASEAVTKSWQDQMTGLIALGNAAQSVDNIFSSYQNLQLRLENAAERVTGAQERLEDAQEKLNRLMKDGSAKASDLADAQKEVDRASRSLTIAENNQARAQNMIVGAYINMGVQTMVLIGSIPKLVVAIKALTVASMEFIVTPIGAALAAVAAVAVIVTTAYIEQKNAVENLKKSNDDFFEGLNKLADAQTRLNDKANIMREAYSQALSAIRGILGVQTQEELDAIAKSKKANYDLIKAKSEGADDYTIIRLERIKEEADAELSLMQAKEDSLQAEVAANEAKLEPLNEIQQRAAALQKMPYEIALEYLQNTFIVEYNNAMQQITSDLQTEVNKQIAELGRLEQARARAYSGQPTTALGRGLDSFFMGAISANNRAAIAKKGGDFIITKTGQFIESSPDDTIMAMKNPRGGGGIVINIDSVYGMNPRELSRELCKELNKKISI